MGKSKKQSKRLKEVPSIQIILDPITTDKENVNMKEYFKEDDEEKNEIEFQNDIVMFTKEVKFEKENIKLLEVELKIEKDHAISLSKKNEESKEIMIILKEQQEKSKYIYI